MSSSSTSTRLSPTVIAQIIGEVEKYPLLYNYNHPDFRNMPKKNEVWNAIAEEVGAKDGEVIHWKWKNLRDSYSRYKKQLMCPPSDDSGSKSALSNWCWAPIMKFVDPFIRKPKDFLAFEFDENEESVASMDSTEGNSSEPIQKINEETISCPISSSKIDNSCNFTNKINTTKTNPANTTRNIIHVSDNINNVNDKKRKFVEVDEVIIENPLKNESDQTNRLDMTDYLFLNYAATFKTLSRKRQALMKLNMAKLFAKAELEELEIDSIPYKFQGTDDTD